ncbi:MAG TPA: hypothetical protein VM582_04700, partial [Candidatus Thermoplasmatota archaeon]|nr:hypothetical protein [Candidatus Thermoplasmatota archaeon]
SWGKVNLASGGHVSGVLPAANGGTGSSVVQFNGPSALRTFTLPDTAGTIVTTNNPTGGNDGKGLNITTRMAFNSAQVFNHGFGIGQYRHCDSACTLSASNTFVIASAAASSYTMTIPTPGINPGGGFQVAYEGKVLFIKKFFAPNTITLQCASSGGVPQCNIDGASSYALAGTEGVILVADGFLEWYVLAKV